MGWSGAVQGYRRFVPGPTHVARDAVAEAVARIPTGARIVDLGAGGRRITPDTFTVDSDASTNPDLLADLTKLPLPDASFDFVFCTGTLEHVVDHVAAARELVRILKPGALAFIDVPFLQPRHADVHDYRRWTLGGLRQFCREMGLEEVDAGAHLGPGSTLSWVVSEYVRVLFGYGAIANVATFAARILLRPLLWIDRWMVGRTGADKIASGVFVLARKP